MGADQYIATDEEKDWATTHARSLDLIVSTVSSPKMPLGDYLSLLKTRGTFIQVYVTLLIHRTNSYANCLNSGAPEDVLPQINA